MLVCHIPASLPVLSSEPVCPPEMPREPARVRVGLFSRLMLVVISLLWLCAAWPAMAQEPQAPARRIAFVVGNANYKNETALKNPHNDVALLARTLRDDLKFTEVIERRDLTRRQLVDLVREVRLKGKDADAVFVYFSGHGMQGPGGNYLIPVDAQIEFEDHVVSEGLAARDLVDALRTANPRVAVLVLDACRDSPYSRRTRSTTKGLSRMNVSGGNLLVAYATGEGETADDGTGRNSPYAQALARHLQQTDEPVLAQFDAVRRTTMQLTSSRQKPTREGDMEVGVYLTRVGAPVPPPRPVELVALKVEATPASAAVRIVNGPTYFDGVTLRPGNYEVEITAPDHHPHRQWIAARNDDVRLKIALKSCFVQEVRRDCRPGIKNDWQDNWDSVEVEEPVKWSNTATPEFTWALRNLSDDEVIQHQCEKRGESAERLASSYRTGRTCESRWPGGVADRTSEFAGFDSCTCAVERPGVFDSFYWKAKCSAVVRTRCSWNRRTPIQVPTEICQDVPVRKDTCSR